MLCILCPGHYTVSLIRGESIQWVVTVVVADGDDGFAVFICVFAVFVAVVTVIDDRSAVFIHKSCVCC